MKKNNISQVLAVILILISSAIYAQSNVAINSSAAVGNSSAILDLSTGNPGTQGFFAPTVALTNVTVQAPIVGTAPDGLLVYTNASPTGGSGPGFYYWNGTKWEFLQNKSTSVTDSTGKTNYIARWLSPTGLGTGLMQDNGTDVGINNAPVANTMVTLTGAAAANGLNATTTYTAASSYAVHGNDTTGADAYLGYNGTFNGLGSIFGYTKAAGYFSGSAGLTPPLVVTTSGTNGNTALSVLSSSWYGAVVLNGSGSVPAILAENDSTKRNEESSEGDGVDGYTSQAYGSGLYGENLYGPTAFTSTVTVNSGVGVMGVGSGVATLSFTPGAGVYGEGVEIGISGFADSTSTTPMTAGGYFANNAKGTAITRGAGTATSYAYVGATFAGTDYKIYGNGTVSTIVKDQNNNRITLFAPEAPEVLFQDYGQGQLANGKTHINLDPDYAKNVTVNEKHPLRVMITMNDACPNTVYVTNRTATGFDVVENNGGTSNAAFTYEVVANRADEHNADGSMASKYQDLRFPEGPAPTPMFKMAKKRRPTKANLSSTTQGQSK